MMKRFSLKPLTRELILSRYLFHGFFDDAETWEKKEVSNLGYNRSSNSLVCLFNLQGFLS